jgi:hypothetical protein
MFYMSSLPAFFVVYARSNRTKDLNWPTNRNPATDAANIGEFLQVYCIVQVRAYFYLALRRKLLKCVKICFHCHQKIINLPYLNAFKPEPFLHFFSLAKKSLQIHSTKKDLVKYFHRLFLYRLLKWQAFEGQTRDWSPWWINLDSKFGHNCAVFVEYNNAEHMLNRLYSYSVYQHGNIWITSLMTVRIACCVKKQITMVLVLTTPPPPLPLDRAWFHQVWRVSLSQECP